jgi:hypothetical protein
MLLGHGQSLLQGIEELLTGQDGDGDALDLHGSGGSFR